MNVKKLLNLQEAAEYLGVSKLTIYGWTSKGKIPYRKIGRLLRFDSVDLEAWTMSGNIYSKKRRWFLR
jgi:excisionase family DNA binding protein